MSPEHKYPIGSHHSSELAKLSTALLIGLLALMSFLLSVGLQRPKPMINVFIYSSFVCLGLGLLAYELASILGVRSRRLADQTAPKGGDEATTFKRRQAKAAKWDSGMRVVQRVLFILSIIAVVGFGISATQLFYPAAAPAASSAPATPTTGQ